MIQNELSANFYYQFLLLHIASTKGSSPDTLAKVIYALETEFKRLPDMFCKHFSNAKDQKEMDGLCWKIILGIENKTFYAAFELIGLTIDMSHDKSFRIESWQPEFDGNFYLRVKTSRTNKNRTYYFRNNFLLNSEIEEFLKIYPNNQNNQDLGLNK